MDTLLPYTRAAEAGECMVAAAPPLAQVWRPVAGESTLPWRQRYGKVMRTL